MARGRSRLKKKQQQRDARRQVAAGARVVASEAAAVASSAEAVASEVTSEAVEEPVELEQAVAVVQEAAAVVQEAADVVASAAATTWPEVERRKRPRFPSLHKHTARVEWKHVALYVPLLLLVILLGIFAMWSFFERQSLELEAVPLP